MLISFCAGAHRAYFPVRTAVSPVPAPFAIVDVLPDIFKYSISYYAERPRLVCNTAIFAAAFMNPLVALTQNITMWAYRILFA
ncbi:MAG TPA: hypothetical protein PK133_11250 [Ferruginibacter sp.]|nr:hypothetical protein [Ferruginibacter sp.]